MKLWVKLILLVLALGLGLSGYIYYEQKQLENSEIQSFEVSFNGTSIEFLDFQMHKPILGKECIILREDCVFLIVDKSIKINQFH